MKQIGIIGGLGPELTVEEAEKQRVRHIDLLGTKFTMEQDFFKTPFEENGKRIYVPEEVTQQYLHEKLSMN